MILVAHLCDDLLFFLHRKGIFASRAFAARARGSICAVALAQHASAPCALAQPFRTAAGHARETSRCRDSLRRGACEIGATAGGSSIPSTAAILRQKGRSQGCDTRL